MGKYIVLSGQNIYDVALHLYGSIEGVVDLLMNNDSLSFDTDLKAGSELIYTDGFVINPDVVSYYRMNGITPANGERNVYYKTSRYPELLWIYLDKNSTSAEIELAGSGEVEIDWGDNSQMQYMSLNRNNECIRHSFDNLIATRRKIRIYGTCEISRLDLSGITPQAVRLLRPVYLERFKLDNCRIDLNFISLFQGTFQMDLGKTKTDSLLALLHCKNLMELELSQVSVTRQVLDEYLIALVRQHYGRRNCHVILTITPSGKFQEPDRDAEHNYALTSGMEAVWLLVNEPAWNEAGNWKFTVNGKVYSNEA